MGEDKVIAMGVVKGKIRKFWWFSINEFWKSIGCLVSSPIFGLGVLIL